MSQTFSISSNFETRHWSVEKLWEVTENLPAVDWEIPPWFTDQWTWGDDSVKDHVERCLDADLDYPILVWKGRIIVDGCHRVIKALALGNKTIKAKIIESMPTPDEVEEEVPSLFDAIMSDLFAGHDFGDVVQEVRAALTLR
jgi:hypothetical protein